MKSNPMGLAQRTPCFPSRGAAVALLRRSGGLGVKSLRRAEVRK